MGVLGAVLLGTFLVSFSSVEAAKSGALPSAISNLLLPSSHENTCRAVYYLPSQWDFVFINGQKCWLHQPPTNVVKYCTGGCYSATWNWLPGNVLGGAAISGAHCQCCNLEYKSINVWGCCWKTEFLSREQTEILRKPTADLPQQICKMIKLRVPTSCSCNSCKETTQTVKAF